jgi:KDO2-lipid IV(A) lauroyltransferase
MWIIDSIALITLQLAVLFINAIPLQLRRRLVSLLVKSVFGCLPQYRKIALKNLRLAFPEQSAEWHAETYRKSLEAFSRVFIDLARLHTLDEGWVRAHVECQYLENYRRIKTERPDCGVLFATGHLGSFELLAHCVPIFGYPISYIVRSFQLPKINRWWKSKRELRGNRAIDRRGAVKETVAEISRGRDVGVLFDQNVTRNHAVFVDFFGRKAATTKLIGIVTLRTECPVVCASIQYLGGDAYRINAHEVVLADIYADMTLSQEAKSLLITERVSAAYEQMVRENPNEWFWFHRRWKTTPEGVPEDFYRS